MTAREWLDNATALREEVKSLGHTADFADDTDREIVELLLRKVDGGFNRLDSIAQDYVPDDQAGAEAKPQEGGSDSPTVTPAAQKPTPPRAETRVPPGRRR